MFIGHFAVAFAMKRVAPEANLGVAVLAATFLDVVWPVLVAAGIEVVKIDPGASFTGLRFVSYPFSHSLAAAVVWGAVFGWVYRFRGGTRRAALWLAAAVVSHWFLDVIVHQPDLQLLPEVDVYVGFGLWDSRLATLIVEGSLFAAGLWLYVSATRARDRAGQWGLWGLVALLVGTYLAFAFGPPPPSIPAVVIGDLLGTAVSVAWAYWVDRHREAVPVR